MVRDNEKIVGAITEKNPQNIIDFSNINKRPMFIDFPIQNQSSQTPQIPFPILFFLFPRIAMMLMMRMEGFGQRKMGIQHITQLVRDKNGYIIEVVEYTR